MERSDKKEIENSVQTAEAENAETGGKSESDITQEANTEAEKGKTAEDAPEASREETAADTDKTADADKTEDADKTADADKTTGEEAGENTGEKTDEKTTGKRKKVLYIAAGCVGALALAYLGIGVYFSSHYLFNTEINGHDVSGKTVKQAEELLKEDIDEYVLELEEIDGSSESITGAEAGLVYESAAGLRQKLESQDAFLWPGALFRNSEDEVEIEVAYDTDKLGQKIDSLHAVTGEQTPAVSAYPKFDGKQYVIEPEQYGTAIQKDVLEEKIAEAIEKLEESLDLEEEKCYAAPAYLSTSKEVKEACDLMNQYCSARIVYPMNEEVVVDASVISGWITVNDKMQVKIDEEAVRLWLEEFGDKYDTVGITRTFRTPAGKEATVSGGTYGWSINEDAEYDVIIDAVKNGKSLEREPEYYIGGTAAAHAMPDWGDTYVDIDLSAQHMWYVADGNIALETDVVTGQPIPERITPEGTYSILEKGRNQVLVGSIDPSTGEPSYRTPVAYWMRVTWSGIGLHDATWQPAFGGTLNQIPGRGSHGCINMPLDQAAALYDMLEVGTPVVIHY